MKRNIVYFILILVLALLLTACSGRSELWAEDVAQFREVVLETHPKFTDEHLASLAQNIEARVAFEKAIDELLQNLSDLSDAEVMAEMQRAAAVLGDNHFFLLLADIETQKMMEIYPLGFRFLTDAFYLLTTEPGFEHALNQRLIAINGREIDDIFAEFSDLWSVENIYNARSSFARLINSPTVLLALGLYDSGETIFFFADDSELILRRDDTVSLDPNTAFFFPMFSLCNRDTGDLPLFLDIRGENLNGHNWFTFIEVHDILYIRLEMYSQNMEAGAFAPFSDEVKTAFEAHAPQAVIIDARHNPGGDNAYLMKLFAFLAEHTDEGMLFHFVDEGSMSASMLGAAHLKSLGAILVGQPLGQNTDFYGFHTTATSADRMFFGDLDFLEGMDLDDVIEIGMGTNTYPYFELIPMTVGEILETAQAHERAAATPITWNHPHLHVNIPNMFLSASQQFDLDLEFYTLRPHILIEHTIQDWISNHDPLLAYVITRAPIGRRILDFQRVM